MAGPAAALTCSSLRYPSNSFTSHPQLRAEPKGAGANSETVRRGGRAAGLRRSADVLVVEGVKGIDREHNFPVVKGKVSPLEAQGLAALRSSIATLFATGLHGLGGDKLALSASRGGQIRPIPM